MKIHGRLAFYAQLEIDVPDAFGYINITMLIDQAKSKLHSVMLGGLAKSLATLQAMNVNVTVLESHVDFKKED